MSVSAHPPVPPPLPPLDPPPESKPDKTTPAVLRYLAAMRAPIENDKDLKAQRQALTHLVRICQCFCRGLYLWNGSGGANEVQWTESQGRGRAEVVREWIEDWLLAQLSRYYEQTDAEIRAAASQLEFRWLGVHCRQALLKEIRQRRQQGDYFPRVSVSLNHSYDDDDPDGDLLSGFVTGPVLNVDNNRDLADPLRVVDDGRVEFRRLGIYDVLHELVRGRNLEKDEVSRVAARLDIGERQARNRIAECYEALRAAAIRECVGRRDRRSDAEQSGVKQLFQSGVKQLFDALAAGEPNQTRYELNIQESRDSRSRRYLLSEAAKDKWDGISARGIRELQAEERIAELNDATPTRAARRGSLVDSIDEEVDG
jgi:hypothetical protein